MTEHCKYCDREKPSYEAAGDSTCAMGGYCEWVQPALVDKEGDIDFPSPEEIRIAALIANRRPSPNILSKRARMWLPLMNLGMNGTYVTFQVQPDLPFKPVGLMLWDVPDDAVLEQCKVMNQEVIICGHGKLPAKAFARAESYEALKKRVEDGEELFNEWLDAPPITPANRIYLLLSSQTGDFEETRAAFWGYGRV